ncbi:MAG: preprotein translocase subunit SecG [Calditrichaeota bacterium]|nr:MAG: preprotein translocase subunit SecG [Calditrichota bacterium]MBL1206764.1 preprotein translocase subunit SecG [Calditrichota bacterium]NOG46590.1 preprotein translocase subunit SecG [Calditrichota bacterium]
MYTFLVTLFVLLSFLMIVIILLQAGKGQGLAGAIGGGMAGQSMFGGRGAADFLTKATTYIATAYMVLALGIGLLYKSEAEDTQKSLIQKKMEEQQANEQPSSLPVANPSGDVIPEIPAQETQE